MSRETGSSLWSWHSIHPSKLGEHSDTTGQKHYAPTKHAFPNIEKPPNESALHSCHLNYLSAGIWQVFTLISKKLSQYSLEPNTAWLEPNKAEIRESGGVEREKWEVKSWEEAQVIVGTFHWSVFSVSISPLTGKAFGTWPKISVQETAGVFIYGIFEGATICQTFTSSQFLPKNHEVGLFG